MASELRKDKNGNLFLVVGYNATSCDWGECLAEAYRDHPGCKRLPCIAVAENSRFTRPPSEDRKTPETGQRVGTEVGKRHEQASIFNANAT
jgi:hypothetical protein